MNIVVTGGAGFIGSNFILYLFENHKDCKIICIDCLTYAGNLDNLSNISNNKNFVFVKANICDKEKIDEIFAKYKPDIVVNFAAESHVDKSITNPDLFIDTNIKGTATLLNACKKYDIKRFHQISTDEVYGDLPLDKKELKFTENTPLNPSSPYSASKASADLLCLSYFRTYKMPITISRCSNNYGAFQYPEKLIPLSIIRIINNLPVKIYGNGSNVRDWIYVKDHCKAIDLIIHSNKIGEVYNIGGNNELSNNEVITQIFSYLNKGRYIYINDRKGHDLRYAINSSKIKSQLNWECDTKFDEGIKETINWYLKHEAWWKKLIDTNSEEI